MTKASGSDTVLGAQQGQVLQSNIHDETPRREAPKPWAMNVSTKALSDTPSDLARMVN